MKLDISPRAEELQSTDRIVLPNSLEFASIGMPEVEVVEIHRHAAEKFHAMLRSFGERENSRVRDLVDLVLMHECELLDTTKLQRKLLEVWEQREGAEPPPDLPQLPGAWAAKYESQAQELGLGASSSAEAVAIATRLWRNATTEGD